MSEKQHMNTASVLKETRWNNVDYDQMTLTTIVIDPTMEDRYDTATTTDIGNIYTKESVNSLLYEIYVESPYITKEQLDYLEKINSDDLTEDEWKEIVAKGLPIKKFGKKIIPEMWIYFRDKIREADPTASIIHIFCAVAEFFSFNYDTLYNDIIPIVDKSQILELLHDTDGYESELKSNRLF